MSENRLTALLEAGFTDRLGEPDRKLLARRALLKAGDEKPPFHLPTSWWYVVPGESYEGLFAALDLHDRVPVTFREGLDVADLPSRPDAVPVFVTPEIDGWRLIFGHLDSVIGWGWDDMMGAVERLSARCGQAQMFFEDIAGGADIWVVAEAGRIRRRYARESDPEWVGELLPWETPATDDEDFDPEFDEAEPYEGTASAMTACEYLSVYPFPFDAEAEIRGHGWLAVSASGVGHEGLEALART
ncbi:hypothetical protein OHT20_36175 [Streptomyces caniferus]|uniref:hypothetical protein n=1 Tax=Streptomyces caniferus TaxID=285557 RepID=UPI002E28B261|nr:hypothetical protein [Streptomyces caniferus]